MRRNESTLKTETRGQAGISTVKIAFIIALAIAAIVGAFLLPTAINEVEGNTTSVHTDDTAAGTNVSINAVLYGNVTAATDGTDATIQLNNNGTTESKTINVGAESTYTTLPDGDVTVGVEEANAANATFNATYASDYSFSDGAKSLWGLVGLVLVLALILYLIGQGTSAFDEMT